MTSQVHLNAVAFTLSFLPLLLALLSPPCKNIRKTTYSPILTFFCWQYIPFILTACESIHEDCLETNQIGNSLLLSISHGSLKGNKQRKVSSACPAISLPRATMTLLSRTAIDFHTTMPWTGLNVWNHLIWKLLSCWVQGCSLNQD